MLRNNDLPWASAINRIILVCLVIVLCLLRVNACISCSVKFSAIKNWQCVCVKFCVKFGKTFSETFEMLKQLFGDEAMSRTRTHSTEVLKRAKLQMRKINVQDNLQHKRMDFIHKKILFGRHIPLCSCLTS